MAVPCTRKHAFGLEGEAGIFTSVTRRWQVNIAHF